MPDRAAIVTGASRGIGFALAEALGEEGHALTLTARKPETLEQSAAKLRERGFEVEPVVANLAQEEGVREVVTRHRERFERLDVLINNAGAAVLTRSLSADGIEMTVAGNHLGPALLTFLLLDLLKSSAPSRIVNVSSEAHRGRHDLSDLQFERRKYNGLAAYGQSKLLMNAFTFELARRLEGSGVTANCLHPGVVATNIWPADGPRIVGILIALARPFMLSAKRGAQVSLYVATSPDVASVSGQYFVKSKPASSSSISRDQKTMSDVWQWTVKTIGAGPARDAVTPPSSAAAQ